MAKTRSHRPGRPAGAKTQRVGQVELVRTQCSACRSTRRSAYWNVRRSEIVGELPDGRRYRTVIWRRTRCLDCGQVRDDKEFVA